MTSSTASASATAKEKLQQVLISALGFDGYLHLVARLRIRSIKLLRQQQDLLFFTRMIPPGSAMLDIGANIGITTYFLKKANPDGALHSFEPIPDNFASLRRIVDRHGLRDVTLHHCGLGAVGGELKMVMPIINGVKRHALCHVVDPAAPHEEGEHFTVPILRLDDLEALAERADIKAMKIDVEDFEYAVFQGALGLLGRCRPIVFCELWDSDNKNKVLELFDGLDYSINLYEAGRLRPVAPGQPGSGNYFLVPREWQHPIPG
jgi:FkbM family methyltransferase